MASGVILTEGFGGVTQYTELINATTGKWFNVAVNGSPNYTISPTYGRYGRNGLRMVTANTSSRYFGTYLGANYTELLIGIAFAPISVGSQRIMVTIGEGGNGTHCSLRIDVGGAISVYRGSTLISGPSSQTYVDGSGYHYLWWRLKGSDTVGTSTVTVDGTQILASTSLDTFANANTWYNGIWIGHTSGSASSQEIWYADIVVVDCSVNAVNKLANDISIGGYFPNAAGNYNTAWPATGAASRQLAIGEIPPDGDTSYVQGAAAGDKVSVGLTDSAASGGQIITVVPYAIHKKTEAGDASIAVGLRQGGTDVQGTTVPSNALYLHKAGAAQDLAPDGGAWDYSKLNATELLLTRVA